MAEVLQEFQEIEIFFYLVLPQSIFLVEYQRIYKTKSQGE